MRSRLVATLLLNSSLLAAQANATLHGRATDARTKAAIVRATIVATRGSDSVAAGDTDSTGSFSLSIAGSGAVTLHLRRIGYEPATVSAVDIRSDVPLELSMRAIPQAIEGVAVTAKGAISPRVVG